MILSDNCCKYERIILIGMPCSGKTSIGRSLSDFYGYTFYDMDEEIVKKAGMTIEEIFRTQGEPAFRAIETQVAFELSEAKSAVIATGGGVVTKEGNMEHFIKPSSLIIFIHRDFGRLATTPKRVMDKRPLLQKTSFEKLKNLYIQRLPLYRKYCTVEVKNETNKEESIIQIKKLIRELNKDE